MPVEPLKGFPPLSRRIFESSDISERAPCCPQCSENYEKEAAKLTTVHKSFTEASLPPWLQNAKLNTSDASQVCLIPFYLSNLRNFFCSWILISTLYFHHRDLSPSRESKNCRGNGGIYVCIFIPTSTLAERLHQRSLWQACIVRTFSRHHRSTLRCREQSHCTSTPIKLLIALQEVLWGPILFLDEKGPFVKIKLET